MSTVIVESNDDDNSDAVSAAEANAHVAEIVAEDAEESAEEAAQAADVALTGAEVSADAAAIASESAATAVEAEVRAASTVDELREVLGGFKDDLLSSLASVLAARERASEPEDTGAGLEVEILTEDEPPVEPDKAPGETHPYFRSWKRGNR